MLQLKVTTETGSYYHMPKTIDDIIDQTVGKVFDYMDIENDPFSRWTGL